MLECTSRCIGLRNGSDDTHDQGFMDAELHTPCSCLPRAVPLGPSSIARDRLNQAKHIKSWHMEIEGTSHQLEIAAFDPVSYL